jgi:2-succinyl-5-enolpyruvyl-6-hydroxy-3-cyclohexene-1-carboxylate synthase
MPIRYLDMVCPTAPPVLCNRGASGIDGIVHTALGATLGCGGRCTLLVGDLATLHDLSALPTLGSSGLPIVVVVLNNGGGGIFRFLPIANHEDVYSPYFDTPHNHDFARCCEGFGLPYTCTRSKLEFEKAFEHARTVPGPHVIEVQTQMEAGHALVTALKGAVRDAAHQLVVQLQTTSFSESA